MTRPYRRHGMTGTPIYKVWQEMIQRCENPRNKRFVDYGGRGIYVSDEWHDFRAFHADMGDRPNDGYSLDRINNDGPYSKENCRWATVAEQNANKRQRRLREVCQRGLHEMTEENTYARAGGIRRCRACRREWDRQKYWQERAAS